MVSREPIRYSVVFVVWVSQLDVKVYDEHLLVCNFFYFFFYHNLYWSWCERGCALILSITCTVSGSYCMFLAAEDVNSYLLCHLSL